MKRLFAFGLILATFGLAQAQFGTNRSRWLINAAGDTIMPVNDYPIKVSGMRSTGAVKIEGVATFLSSVSTDIDITGRLAISDSIRVEKTSRQKGTITFGATATSGTLASNGKITSPDTVVSVKGFRTEGTSTLKGQTLHGTGSDAAPELSSNNDTNTGIRFPGSDITTFVQGGAEKARIDPNGINVGATTTPKAKLQVTATGISAADYYKGLRLSNPDAATNGVTVFSPALVQRAAGFITSSVSDSVLTAQYTYGVQAVTAPTSVIKWDFKIGASAWANKMSLTSSGNLTTTRDIIATNALKGAYLEASIANASVQIICDAANNNNTRYIRFGRSGYATPAVEFARFTYAGNLGLGTTTPAALLHVNNANVLSKPLFRLSRDNNTTPDSLAGGVTGMGKWFVSTNPADTTALFNVRGRKTTLNLLDISNDYDGSLGDSTFKILPTGGFRSNYTNHMYTTNTSTSSFGSYGALVLQNLSNTNNNYSDILASDVSGTVSSGISFKTTNHTNHYGLIYVATRSSAGWHDANLTVTANKLGIGGITPVNTLDVEGAAAIGATYSGTNTAPSNGLLVEGNVGIGITSPGSKLDVHGDKSTDSLLIVSNDRVHTSSYDSVASVQSDGSIHTSGNVKIGKFLKRSVTATISAASPGAQGDVPLTSDINEVSVCGTPNDAVTLPAAEAGLEIMIINNGAQTLEIWPASGDDAGAGADTAITLAAGSNVTLVAYNATNWEVK